MCVSASRATACVVLSSPPLRLLSLSQLCRQPVVPQTCHVSRIGDAGNIEQSRVRPWVLPLWESKGLWCWFLKAGVEGWRAVECLLRRCVYDLGRELGGAGERGGRCG